ncbi:hypothetical protein BDW69DRAFT_98092 [Aspergillus filifer]
MCEHFIQSPPGPQGPPHRWRVHRLGCGDQVQDLVARDSSDFGPGRYIVLGPASDVIALSVTNEGSLREIPLEGKHPGRRNQGNMRRIVVRRDKAKYNLTGEQGLYEEEASPLTASYIFPVSRYRMWMRGNYERHITDQTLAQQIGPNGIFSVQNALLLTHNPDYYCFGRLRCPSTWTEDTGRCSSEEIPSM